MSKTDLLKSGLQLFAGGEDVAIDSLLDLLGDHGDMVNNMSDEAVAMLVVASRLENIGRILEGINESLGALAECVDEVPLTSYAPGYTFLRIGGGVEAGY